MKILTEELTDFEKEVIEANLTHSEIKEVGTRTEAYNYIENHFGTLKCKSEKYDSTDGEIWIIYPPKGVYGEGLTFLIKE